MIDETIENIRSACYAHQKHPDRGMHLFVMKKFSELCTQGIDGDKRDMLSSFITEQIQWDHIPFDEASNNIDKFYEDLGSLSAQSRIIAYMQGYPPQRIARSFGEDDAPGWTYRLSTLNSKILIAFAKGSGVPDRITRIKIDVWIKR